MSEKQENSTRQFSDLAVCAGRSKQSPQTSYVHYCYEALDEGVHDTIPIVDNILFALGLLGTRQVDAILEAKSLLEKLLHFQDRSHTSATRGNFPEYLHQYPLCKNQFTAVLLLAPFYWILKNFSVAIGRDLKEKITKSSQSLLNYCLTMHKTDPAPFQMAIRIAAANKAFGELWNDSDRRKEGIGLLDQLKIESEAKDFGKWCCPSFIADTLVALQMAYSSIAKSPWKDFWQWLAFTYNRSSCCFIGPAIKAFHWKKEPQATLYDLYLGYFSGAASYFSFIDHPYQLQGVLIQPTDDPFPEISYPFTQEGELAGYRWQIHQKVNYGCSLIQKMPLNAELERGYHPLFFSWGSKVGTHTLVCQGGNSTFIDFQATPDKLELFFNLSEPVQVEDKEKSREISFYLEEHEGMKILVENLAANTFQLGDILHLQSPEIHLSLTFQLLDGEGRFFGHIAPGNRPSQLCTKGTNRFNLFDWQIFLRTVRRPLPCLIKAEINIL